MWECTNFKIQVTKKLPCAVLDGIDDTIDGVTVSVDDTCSVLISVESLELGTGYVVGIGLVVPKYN